MIKKSSCPAIFISKTGEGPLIPPNCLYAQRVGRYYTQRWILLAGEKIDFTTTTGQFHVLFFYKEVSRQAECLLGEILHAVKENDFVWAEKSIFRNNIFRLFKHLQLGFICIPVFPLWAASALQNRATALELFQAGIERYRSTKQIVFGTPRTVPFYPGSKHTAAGITKIVQRLEHPLIIKPLFEFGRQHSHCMWISPSLSHTVERLLECCTGAFGEHGRDGFILQEYIHHGKAMHKIYLSRVDVEYEKRITLQLGSLTGIITVETSTLKTSFNKLSAEEKERALEEKADFFAKEETFSFCKFFSKQHDLCFVGIDVVVESKFPHRHFLIDINPTPRRSWDYREPLFFLKDV